MDAPRARHGRATPAQGWCSNYPTPLGCVLQPPPPIVGRAATNRVGLTHGGHRRIGTGYEVFLCCYKQLFWGSALIIHFPLAGPISINFMGFPEYPEADPIQPSRGSGAGSETPNVMKKHPNPYKGFGCCLEHPPKWIRYIIKPCHLFILLGIIFVQNGTQSIKKH